MKAFALFLLLALPLWAHAQQPAPPVPPPATIDQLFGQIKTLRAKQNDLQKQKDDLAKQEAAVANELKAKLKELSAALAELGLIDPPAPVPPPKPPEPPTPPDPLKAKLLAAYTAAAGTDAQKKEWAKDLAALYRAAAKLAGDPTVATATALKVKLTAAAGALVGADALTEVRKAVAGELAAILGAADADLTADQRTAANALFTKLASIIDGLAN